MTWLYTAIATAIKPGSERQRTPHFHATDTFPPAHKIELQEKMLKQIELLHKMCKSGAITDG